MIQTLMTGQTDNLALNFQPATPSRWPDVEELFGERGACGGCWCMFWRVPRKDYEANKGAGNKRAFKRIITSGAKPGILAYIGKEPVGWCAVAPREDYIALERSRVLKPVDCNPSGPSPVSLSRSRIAVKGFQHDCCVRQSRLRQRKEQRSSRATR